MKAFLLAAGVGSRLRPLTDRIPKCLVPICGVPLLGIWFEMLVRYGVTEALVNTHHLAEQVRDYVKAHKPADLAVRLVHEPELLGSAGTVSANRDFVAGEQDFFIIYADNLTDADLGAFLRFHRRVQSPFTMGLFPSPDPHECGIATLDATGRVTAFEEKPENPADNLANSGLYIAGPKLFEYMPDRSFMDFGFDVLPGLVGTIYGFELNAFYCDTGTPERLARARKGWAERYGLQQESDDEIC